MHATKIKAADNRSPAELPRHGEFVVVWSGELERAGLCPGLSSYIGPSSLAPEARGPAPGEEADV